MIINYKLSYEATRWEQGTILWILIKMNFQSNV